MARHKTKAASEPEIAEEVNQSEADAIIKKANGGVEFDPDRTAEQVAEDIAKAADPEHEPKPETVLFVAEASGQGVWDAENDRMLAQFVAGKFSTDDPRIIAILDACDCVRRA